MKQPFKAIKGKNTFHYGAKLEPTVAQKELAKRAVLNVKDKLPSRVKNKINERYRKEGHYHGMLKRRIFFILKAV